MTSKEFLNLLKQLYDEEDLEVREQVEMTHPNGQPILDEYGVQIVNDVVKVGDGWFYIERDDNEPQSVQLVIDLLANLQDHLADLIAAFETHVEAQRWTKQ